MLELFELDPREVHDFDLVTTRKFTFEGQVKLEHLAFRSPTLGDFTVVLGRIESMMVYGNTDAMLTIDAAKYGSSLDTWMPTGVQLNSGEAVDIRAAGQVELWPQGPGQYLATPKGHNTTLGKGGQYIAGALIGKIGANGRTFLIGEWSTIRAEEHGELFLQIVPSPWNNASTGNYSVSIKGR